MDNQTSTSLSQTNSNIDNSDNGEAALLTTAQVAVNSATELTSGHLLELELITSKSMEKTNPAENAASVDTKIEQHYTGSESTKVTNHEQNDGSAIVEHHRIDIHDSDQHLDKSISTCSMLNKSLLALAIICFALFLASIVYISTHYGKEDHKHYRSSSLAATYSESSNSNFNPLEFLSGETYFNLTRNNNSIIVVLSRRGASVQDILVPYKNNDEPGLQYRSVVIKGEREQYFGSIRFGFDDPKNPFNMTSKLPAEYPFINLHKEDWSMYIDPNNPYRVRFIYKMIQIIYEISSKDSNEFSMKTIVAPLPTQVVVVDVTNNIFFNLRGNGNLSTHYLNLSLSNPINVMTGQKVEQDRLIQPQRVDQLSKLSSYFYTLDRAGVGKNHIATLSEIETKTTMRVFSDHAGVGILLYIGKDEINLTEAHGIRISPRQSPAYQPMLNYGQTHIAFPSEAMHTTWWQFAHEY